MTKVLDWKKSDDVRDIVHLSVQALAEGHVVALPTCTSYIAAAIATDSGAIEQLLSVANSQLRPSNGSAHHNALPLGALIMRHGREVLDYCPAACPTAQRLALRTWPGPTQILAPARHRDSLLNKLPKSITDLVLDHNGYARLCQPAHPSIQEITRLSAGPLAIAPLFNRRDGSLAVTADAIDSSKLSLVVDAGLTKYQGRPTVVKVSENACEIVESGITSRAELQSLSRLFVMLVCTGNTCRSPMAERLLEAKIAEKFASKAASPARIDGRKVEPFGPILAISAGIAAAGGGPASPQAISAMQELGIDLSDHQSCAVTEKEIESADLILAMTRSHLQAIIARWPDVAKKAHLLNPDGYDVSDPFGGPVSIYRDCAMRISEYLDDWIERLSSMPLPKWLED